MTDIIYKPKGKALEYSDDALALNIYNGCSGGCTYPCYNTIGPISRKDYHTNVFPLKKLNMRKLRKECKELSGKKVNLCFGCDPFQQLEKEQGLTYMVLNLFKEFDIIPVILTKGKILKMHWDLIKTFPEIHIGVTITCLSKWKEWEPGCISVNDRIQQLNAAKSYGCKTWISFEPIINWSEIEWLLISEVMPKVDYMKFGKWNYNKLAKDIDWELVVQNIYRVCKKQGYKYMIKESLKEYEC